MNKSGRTLTEEHKQKISSGLAAMWNSGKRKRIQITEDMIKVAKELVEKKTPVKILAFKLGVSEAWWFVNKRKVLE